MPDPLTLIHGDALGSLRTLGSVSVQCVVTSPPYWSLRDYGIEPLIWDGAEGCDHQWGDTIAVNATNHTDKRRWNHTRNGRDEEQPTEKRVAWLRTIVDQGNVCETCGAWRGCLGLEPTTDLYVQHVVDVFREVKRVLRNDGTVFLNLGDSYFSNPGNGRGGGSTLLGGKPHLSGAERVSGYDSFGKATQDCPSSGWSSENPCDEHTDVSVNHSLRTALRLAGEQSLASCLRIQEYTAELRDRLPTGDCSRQRLNGQFLVATQDRLQSEAREVLLALSVLASTNLESSSQCAVELTPTGEPSAFLSLLESFAADVQACAHRLDAIVETSDCTAGIVSLCAELERRTQYTSAYCSQLVSWANYTNPQQRFGGNLKPKDLVGIPWMVAFALRADGWYLRSDIIWSKPNPMPESVTDRPTKSHEYIFLLSKSQKYFYDAEAIKEPNTWADHNRFGNKDAAARLRTELTGNMRLDADPFTDRTGRNKRSVWTVTTQPFSEAHFATFPTNLITPCILAGAPVGGVVLDPFAGSGTTAKVAIELGRKAIAIEPKAEYVEMIKRRCQTTIGLPLIA